MTYDDYVQRLFWIFPDGKLDKNRDFVTRGGIRINLSYCCDKDDVIIQILENHSKDVIRDKAFRRRSWNDRRKARLIKAFNQYIGADLTEEDWRRIKAVLCNTNRHTLARRFMQSLFDMKILDWYEEEQRARAGEIKRKAGYEAARRILCSGKDS